MAVLNGDELAELRQRMASKRAAVTWTKPQVNAALQAIEDVFEASRASFGTAIEAAVPGVFNALQKKALVAHYLGQKSGRDSV